VLIALKALRLVMGLGIAALLLASATLLLYGVVESVRHIVRLVVPGLEPMTNRDIFLSSIKLADLILLATIMQMVGIGLYPLFAERNLPIPGWLRTIHVDELKNKLAGMWRSCLTCCSSIRSSAGAASATCCLWASASPRSSLP
jgi:uncharacterized membrane protein YqhA